MDAGSALFTMFTTLNTDLRVPFFLFIFTVETGLGISIGLIGLKRSHKAGLQIISGRADGFGC
jgi:hypothetical protein